MAIIEGKLHSCNDAFGKIEEAKKHLKENRYLAWGTYKQVGIGTCETIFIREKGDPISTPIFAQMKVEKRLKYSDLKRDMRPEFKPVFLSDWDQLDDSQYYYLISDISDIKIPLSDIQDRNGEPIPSNKIATDFRNIQVEIENQSSEDIIKILDEEYSNKPGFEENVVTQIRRPSELREAILRKRGTVCQICKYPGFKKKDGTMYAETHHMIELNKMAPNTLQSWNILVLCPTCHREMHYGDVTSEFLGDGWKVHIDRNEFIIK